MSDEKVRNYRDLLVWQKGIALVKQVYALTRTFPADEKFGLVAQMRRAAVSIPSNIAEGQSRHTTNEFVRFLSLAEGSLAELDTQRKGPTPRLPIFPPIQNRKSKIKHHLARAQLARLC